MQIDNSVIRSVIQSLYTTIVWLLNIRLTVLLLPLLLLNWRLFLLILPVSISIDLIITMSSVFLAYKNDIKVFQDDINKYIDGKNVKIVESKQLQNIKSYFANYQNDSINKRMGIGEKQYIIVQVSNLYSYISHSFTAGYSVIIIPETFDETEKRDIALLAHEYIHAAFHNTNKTLNVELLFVAITVLLIGIPLFVTSLNVFFFTWILLFFCFTLFYIKTSLHGIREIEANLFGLRYIEDTFGERDLEQVSLKLLKMRQQEFLNDDKRKNFTNKLFSSDLNQIKYLVIFTSLEERKKIVNRLIIQKGKENNRTKRIKIHNLLRVYRKTVFQWKSTHGIQLFPFSGTYLFSLVFSIGFFWVELYHLSELNFIPKARDYIVTVAFALSIMIVLLLVATKKSFQLSNKLKALWNRLGIKIE